MSLATKQSCAVGVLTLTACRHSHVEVRKNRCRSAYRPIPPSPPTSGIDGPVTGLVQLGETPSRIKPSDSMIGHLPDWADSYRVIQTGQTPPPPGALIGPSSSTRHRDQLADWICSTPWAD
ncbi:hypothetical protein BO94DRAFT_271034 [Aspergillus sclerotioniger CBS 115572]|uniref:Uncharacterized protein n=1 Tax=Aspergillus sclerotioniger CBS 115572 TaxID=1450535 RepID=A0A317V8C1_9EURO|nr:hypothetical protein BO94DRAFT_271034 [Aspergillus sclerotioniger CBS 115572]PWY70386.1 hypothetical protein BO94DRAFT_271034 [Aspergillus sclerotioniger CBS 115572]